MRPLIRFSAALLAAALMGAGGARAALPVVAAENFYGDVARQVGGDLVSVTSILTNPSQDPHLFEAGASAARAVADARVVILNGLDYDPWMERLIAASGVPAERVIVAGTLVGRVPGDNPHIWYDPATMVAVARAAEAAYVQADPTHAATYARNLAVFEASLEPLQARIAMVRQRLRGRQVTATEPVFGFLLASLGIMPRNQRFQLAVMNGTEASASDLAAFEDDLRLHRVALLVVNRQASDAVADRMAAVARQSGVPVVGASETEPPGTTYQAWMLRELDAVDRAAPPP